MSGLKSEQLQGIIQILIEYLSTSVESTRDVVRWLKIILRTNIDTISALPSIKTSLNTLLPVLKKKEALLPVVCRMKGKLEVLIQARSRKREMDRDRNELEVMKPLIEITAGCVCITVGGLAHNGDDEVDNELDPEEVEEGDGEIDDQLEDELLDEEDDEKLYQEAYENEGLDEEEVDEGEGDEEEEY